MRATTGAAAGALATGGAVVVGLWMLFERVQRPALEGKSYVESIHRASQGWVRNTDELMQELGRMPGAAAAFPELASRYADGIEAS